MNKHQTYCFFPPFGFYIYVTLYHIYMIAEPNEMKCDTVGTRPDIDYLERPRR